MSDVPFDTPLIFSVGNAASQTRPAGGYNQSVSQSVSRQSVMATGLVAARGGRDFVV